MSRQEQLLRTFTLVVQLVVFTAPLGRGLPRRPHVRARCAGAVALLLAAELAQDPLRGIVVGPGGNGLLTVMSFAITLVELVVAFLLVWDVTVWQALFCASAGYIAQNIASGLLNLLTTVSEATGTAILFQETVLDNLLVTAAIFPLYYHYFVRRVNERQLTLVSDPEMMLAALAVISTVIGLDVAIKSTSFEVGDLSDTVKSGTITAVSLMPLVLMRLAHGSICAFVLYSMQKVLLGHQLATEREVERRVAAERERQYELSRSNIDAINLKCHDIKHQIRSLAAGGTAVDSAALADLEHEVDVYDLILETGNAALDTILTEKGLICSREGITLSTIADGSALDHMADADIYALFGNALDNAIEATRKVADAEERIITLNVRREREMVVIGISNPCPTEPHFVDGLPRSTKGDALNHGFGMRSMRTIAEKYDGTLTCSWNAGAFSLSVLLV